MIRSLKVTLEMIKIEHTLFALPFALLGAVLAARGLPALAQVGWITVAMVGARSAAMAFNRLADREIDASNPRTRLRALPAGLLSARFVALFSLASAMIFFWAAAMLNRLALLLAPVALASVLLYSYTKRFTAFSHLVLGWCLAIASTGAWIAVRGTLDSATPLLLSLAVMLWTAGFDIIYACQDRDFDLRAGLHSIPQWLGIARALWVARALHAAMFAVLLSLAVMLWTAGFDIIYACQDWDFDLRAGLHSIPQWLGIARALWVARALHAAMFAVLLLIYFVVGLHWPGLIGIVATAALLIRQHRLVRADDLSQLNAAFFTTNAYISIILFAAVAADVFLNT